MNSQNNFNIYATSRDWYANVTPEFDATWGRLPQFQGDTLHMQFMRAQTCWLETDLQDISTRRQCVYASGQRILDNPKSPLIHWWNFIGVESVSGKVADAVCTLYNDAPYREFTEGLHLEGDAQTLMQEALTDLYEQYNVNLAFKTAYRYALFVNCVVLMPDFENHTILVLTPDMFRFLGPELWYAKYRYDEKGKQYLEYHAWDANVHRVVDTSGKEVSRENNPYGRVPATILKLNQTTELYGSGITECAEINVYQNLINLFTTKIGVFQSHSILWAKNISKDELEEQYTGAGSVLAFEGSKLEGVEGPSLEYISPQNFIEGLENLKQKRVRQFMLDQGLPVYLVSDGTQLPSGVALVVAKEQISERTKGHVDSLVKAEKDFADLMALGTNLHDVTRSVKVGKITVKYREQRSGNDPAAELKHDQEKAAQGLMPPEVLLEKWTGLRMTPEEANKYMKDNKGFFSTSELRSTVGGAQAMLAAQIAYEAGQITQAEGISFATNVMQYPPEVAATLFPQKLQLAA